MSPAKGYDLAHAYIACAKKYGFKYAGNINKDQWAFARIAEVIGKPATIELINWYFDEYGGEGDPSWFLYNYDKVQSHREMKLADRAKRELLRAKTREKMNDSRG